MNLIKLKKALLYQNLTVRQLAVLFVLSHGACKLRDVAKELSMPRGSVCRAWDKLAELKLIRRSRHPYSSEESEENNDARDVSAVLTSAGVQFISKLI